MERIEIYITDFEKEFLFLHSCEENTCEIINDFLENEYTGWERLKRLI